MGEQVSEDFNFHLNKVDQLKDEILKNKNIKDIKDIITDLNNEINNNWKKINNKYWFPKNTNISFRDTAEKEDLLYLINKKYIVDNDIMQSNTSYNIKVLNRIHTNLDLIDYFFTADLIDKLNNSSIKDILGCLIEYSYNETYQNNETHRNNEIQQTNDILEG